MKHNGGNYPDMMTMINQIQQKLLAVERKIDILINQGSTPIHIKPIVVEVQELAGSHKPEHLEWDEELEDTQPEPEQPTQSAQEEKAEQAPQQEAQPQQPRQQQSRQPRRRHDRNRNRPMFKAVCADCKKDCEIPFEPRPERAVYCRECYAQRKAANTLKPVVNADPAPAPVAEVAPVEQEQSAAKRDPKRRPAAPRKSAPRRGANKGRTPKKPGKKK